MKSKDVFATAKGITNLKQVDIASLVGIPENSIAQKINVRETIKLQEFVKILEIMGIGMYYHNPEKNVIIIREGFEPRFPDEIAGSDIIRYKDNGNVSWEVLKIIINLSGLRLSQIEMAMGYYVQELEYKTKRRGSIKADEWFDVMEAQGFDIYFFLIKTGERMDIINFSEAEAPKIAIKAHDEGIAYDTSLSKYITTTRYADGNNEFGLDDKYQDIYVDKSGKYFYVCYTKDGTKPYLRTLPYNIAKAVLGTYKNEKQGSSQE